MNIVSKTVSKIMHLGDSEKPAEEPKPEEQPTEQPQPEESKPEEASQEQPASEPAPQEQPQPEQPAIEPPPVEPSTPEVPKQQEPYPEQPTESQTQKPQPPQGQPLPPNQRVDAAYKLVYGESAEVPTKHEAIVTPESAEWQIRYYMGGLFAVPNNHLLTQKFSSVDELLTWFDQAYPIQQQEEQSE